MGGPTPELAELQQALEADDPGRLDQAVDELASQIATQADPDAAASTALDALKLLRRNRKFPAMLRVAEGGFRAGIQNATMTRFYAQALIEEGLLGAALATLGQLRQNPGGEADEVEGLIGRVHKQRYVTDPPGAGAERDLRAAIDAYLAPYAAEPSRRLWHGVNTIALLARAERDGVSVGRRPEWKPMAEQLVLTIDSLPADRRDIWDAAIAAEALVALGRFGAAGDWLATYTQDPEVDAFAIAGSLRQLRQVWQIDETEPRQRALVSLLEARLLGAEGGRLEVNAPQRADELERDDALLERVFDNAAYQTIQWYRAGLEAARSVVRIVRHLAGTIGTGFVVPGAALHPSWADRTLVMTNFHVTNRQGIEPGLFPADVRVMFEDNGRNIPVREILWESAAVRTGTNPPGTLDTAILVLEDGPIPAPSYGIAPDRQPEAGERVYVIGHPMGKDLAFSLEDNKVLGATDQLVHYRAPTEPGSSGSPVFDDAWRVVGLHHGGGTALVRLDDVDSTYEANEGLRFSAIRQLARAEVP